MPEEKQVPRALKAWFVIHFITDVLFAIPLMIAPVWTLTLFGWQTVDPFTARVISAALFGIGIESWLGRERSADAYRGMLTLKVIWSGAVIVGVLISLAEGAQGRPMMAWVLLGVFVFFNLVWLYWLRWLTRR